MNTKAGEGRENNTDQQTKQHAVLYRKYRPAAFDQVIGQEHVVDSLTSAITAGRVGHAYLFAGGRGTGKTSIARIFARALGVSPADIYEMDAASNRTVEDARALREAVHTLPFESKHKVYIIDEAHMLTKDAFNTLLKTLEEPPLHALFILATTELDKVPDTIVSRCQTFLFKKPDVITLKKVLTDIAQAEGFVLDKGAAELLALLGDGSFRDALSTLQKVIGAVEEGNDATLKQGADAGKAAKNSKEITLSMVERITGTPSLELITSYVEAFFIRINTAQKKGGGTIQEGIEHAPLYQKGLIALQDALSQGMDMRIFAVRALGAARSVLLLVLAEQVKDNARREKLIETIRIEYGASAERLITLASQMKTVTASALQNAFIGLIDAIPLISRSPIASLPLELLLIQ